MSPYKVFNAGEDAISADVNTYLGGQVIPRFTDAAQRTSQLAAPVLNQLSMLDTRPGVQQYWNGSAWVDTQTFIQSGIVNLTTDGSGQAVLSFPTAFSGNPTAVVVTVYTAGTAYFAMVLIGTVLPGSVRIQFANTSGVGPAAASLWIYWIATGLRP